MSELARRQAASRKAHRSFVRVERARAEHVSAPSESRGTSLPPVFVMPDRYVRTLLALIEIHERQGRATMAEVGLACGRSPQIAHKWLHRLAGFGLVDVGTPGGLRPLVTAHQPIPNQEATAP